MYRNFKDFITNQLLSPISLWLMNRYKIDITPLDLMRVIESKGKYVKEEKIEEDDVDNIEVYPGNYRNIPNIYLETKHHFIIQRLSLDELVVIGISDNGKDRLLNNEEKKIAREMGLQVLDD